MKKVCCIICFLFLYNCTKKDVFETSNIIENLAEIISVETIGGSKNDAVKSIVKTLDGGYIMTGFTQSNDNDLINKRS